MHFVSVFASCLAVPSQKSHSSAGSVRAASRTGPAAPAGGFGAMHFISSFASCLRVRKRVNVGECERERVRVGSHALRLLVRLLRDRARERGGGERLRRYRDNRLRAAAPQRNAVGLLGRFLFRVYGLEVRVKSAVSWATGEQRSPNPESRPQQLKSRIQTPTP